MNIDAPTITAISTLITSIGALIYAVRGDINSRRNTVLGKQNASRIEEVHIATNGLVQKIGDAKLAQGDATGHERGLQQGRDEAASEKKGAAEERARVEVQPLPPAPR